jgi:hypothetical protein
MKSFKKKKRNLNILLDHPIPSHSHRAQSCLLPISPPEVDARGLQCTQHNVLQGISVVPRAQIVLLVVAAQRERNRDLRILPVECY